MATMATMGTMATLETMGTGATRPSPQSPQGPQGLRSPQGPRPSQPAPAIILPHGGYHKLLTYQKSDIIYQGTVIFTQRFLSRGDRTIDQMVQAARSGKQNIVEGSEDLSQRAAEAIEAARRIEWREKRKKGWV